MSCRPRIGWLPDDVDLAHLADEVWAGSATQHGRALVKRTCGELGGFSPQVMHVGDDAAEIGRAVAAGRAVTFAGPLTAPGSAVVRRPVRGAPQCAAYLSWPSTTPTELAHQALATLRAVAETVAGRRPDVVQRLAYQGRATSQWYATTA